jgi:hypothetical protein
MPLFLVCSWSQRLAILPTLLRTTSGKSYGSEACLYFHSESKWRGATLACGWGGGESKYRRLERKPGTLSTLWCTVYRSLYSKVHQKSWAGESLCWFQLIRLIICSCLQKKRRKEWASVSSHCKKGLMLFPSPAGMSRTKLSLAGNNLIIPGQGEFSMWHPAWGRENR